MKKVLVIKNADFSANALDKLKVMIDITSQFVFEDNKLVVARKDANIFGVIKTSTSNKYKTCKPIDVSQLQKILIPCMLLSSPNGNSGWVIYDANKNPIEGNYYGGDKGAYPSDGYEIKEINVPEGASTFVITQFMQVNPDGGFMCKALEK